MKKYINLKLYLYLLIIFFVFLLDRVSKVYILNLADLNGEVSIYINNFLNFILIWNEGIGFGLFSNDSKFYYNTFTALIIIINIIIIYLMLTSKDFRGYIFSVILGGSLGNLFDRLYYSAVPDFIDLNYNSFHWFVFNVADIFISIGIVCLIFVELFSNKLNVKNEK